MLYTRKRQHSSDRVSASCAAGRELELVIPAGVHAGMEFQIMVEAEPEADAYLEPEACASLAAWHGAGEEECADGDEDVGSALEDISMGDSVEDLLFKQFMQVHAHWHRCPFSELPLRPMAVL